MNFLVTIKSVCPERHHPLFDRLMSSTLAHRLASGAVWSIFGTAAARCLTFISMILIAHLLGKDVYGEFGIIRSTSYMLLSFTGFGIGLLATKYVSEFLVSDKKRIGRIIGLSYIFTFCSATLTSLLLYIFSPWICESLMHQPHLVWEMRLGAGILFLVTMMLAQNGVLMGFQDFRALALTGIFAGTIAIPLYIFGAYYYGLFGALSAMMLSFIINILINGCFIYRNTKYHGIRYDFLGSYREFSLLCLFSVPRFLCELSTITLLWFCQVLAAAQPNGTAELGIFFAALNIQTILAFLPAQISSVMLPVLSEKMGENNQKQWYQLNRINIITSLICSLSIALPTAVLAKQIMGIYGTEFQEGWLVLLVMCLGSILLSLIYVFHGIFASQGKMWIWFCLNSISFVANIATVLIGFRFVSSSLALALGMFSANAVSCIAITLYFRFNQKSLF